MEELINTIKAETEALNANLDAYAKGNKAAGRRARKATLALAKLGKEFRVLSIEADKK